MSVQSMSWVIDHSQHKGAELLCLLMIANHANADGSGSYPSFNTLAKECRMSRRQIMRLVERLAASGELRIERGAGPGGANLYHLPLQTGDIAMSPVPSDKMSPPAPAASDKMSLPSDIAVSPPPSDILSLPGDTAMSPKPSIEPSVVATASARELPPTERRVVARIQQVRGMAAVADAEIADHLAEILADLPPVSDQTLLSEALKFRDYWNERRAQQPTGSWRGWRRAMTNWFSKTRDAPPPGRNGRHDPEPQPEPRRRKKVLSDGSVLWLDY